MAERLSSGLQNRVPGFNSPSRLNKTIFSFVNLKKSFLKFFVGAVFVSALFFISINLHATEIKVEKVEAKPITFTPQITIPGSEIFKKGVPFTITKETMPTMARDLYKFLVGSAGMVAVVVMMAGGYLWLFAGGNTARVGQAKDYISGAVIGLTLALGSYMILNMINPDLINMKDFEIPTVPKITIPEPPTVAGYKWPGLDCKWVAGGVPNEGGYIAVKLEKNQRVFCGNTPASAQIETSKTVNNEGSGQASTVAADYTCYCKITSQCTAVSSGDCSVSNLEKYFGDKITAEMASGICKVESGGNSNSAGTDRCYGDEQLFSIGLFQFNLRQHNMPSDVNNINNEDLICKNAFSSVGMSEGFWTWMKAKFSTLYKRLGDLFTDGIKETDYDCKVTNFPLYTQCVNSAKNATVNISKAVKLSKQGTDWSQWGANGDCKFPPNK